MYRELTWIVLPEPHFTACISCPQVMQEDRAMGLVPFYVETTLGTTSCCSFDNLAEIGESPSNSSLAGGFFFSLSSFSFDLPSSFLFSLLLCFPLILLLLLCLKNT